MEPTADVPRTLGRYQLLARIATGGMGEVFLARLEGAAGFEKLYAVKRILPHLASEQRFRAMLISEAQIASRMSHPNICQVYELGESDGQLYIAMEYLEGTSLDGLLRAARKNERPLELGCVATVLRQTADALHHAHELRDRDGAPLELVHRDVSPGNIFICTSGSAKVLDFGIAKVKHGAQTQTGTVKGKYAYMAPEQLRGGELSRAVDVFALGAVLFEMLALRRLFQRETDYLTFQAVLEDPLPDLQRYRADANDAIVATIAKALSRDPKQRFATVRAFCDAALASLATKPWSEDQVGELVRTAMSTELAQTNEAVTKVIGGAPIALAAPITNVTADDLPPVEAAPVEAAPVEAVPEVATKKSRALWWAVLAVLVAGAGVAIAFVMTREKSAPAAFDFDALVKEPPPEQRESDMKAVIPRMSQLNDCAIRHPTTEPRAVATITIGKDGRARAIKFEPEGLPAPLATCMNDVLGDIGFATRTDDSLLVVTINMPKR